MNSLSNYRSNTRPTRPSFSDLFRKFTKRVVALFEPEEVEVTFKKEGNNITYTYTKVTDKQVA
jgi:hypothetical protein